MLALLFEVVNVLDLPCPTTLLRECLRDSNPLVLMADGGEHRLVAPGRSHTADSAATVQLSY
jgi:uncharacterized protein (UPF0216 family)